MLLNNKGFTLVEVLVAFSLIMLLVTTFVPISTLLQQQTVIFSDRRIMSSKLHDELQVILWDKKAFSSETFTKQVNDKNAIFRFTREDDLIKGCVKWDNINNKKEEICLYGLN